VSGRRRAAPLEGFRLGIAVRFSECDLYGVVWHGRYAVYLEELRNAVTRKFGWSVQAARESGYLAPVTRMEISYHAPARIGAALSVVGRLREPEVARFVFDYEIRDASGGLLTSAMTEQVLTRLDGELLIGLPEGLKALAARIVRGQDDPAEREL
jgi:acyl-CoA thioester hydrolase